MAHHYKITGLTSGLPTEHANTHPYNEDRRGAGVGGGGLFIVFTAIWEVLLKILRFGRIFLRALVFFFFFPFNTRRECFFFVFFCLFANRSLSLSLSLSHIPQEESSRYGLRVQYRWGNYIP